MTRQVVRRRVWLCAINQTARLTPCLVDEEGEAVGTYERKRSEGDIYHVYSRGTGRRIIFEDDDDRLEYCRRLAKLLNESDGELYAWCLMGNHVHLLLHGDIKVIGKLMQVLTGGYARWFNVRHGRSGHLYEARYGSQPICSDAQLMQAVRYIHRNPIGPKISKTCDYAWSSYREYLGFPYMTSTDFVMAVFGGRNEFVTFHEKEDSPNGSPGSDWKFIDDTGSELRKTRMENDEAIDYAKELVGAEQFEMLPSLPKPERDRILAVLRESGMSIRQIAIITGVGKNIVAAARPTRQCV